MPLRLGSEPSGIPALSDSVDSGCKLLAVGRVGVKERFRRSTNLLAQVTYSR